jgi:C4-dicarboxylate-specific signal transduction histidine kinase
VVTGLMSGRTFYTGRDKLIHFTLVDITRQRQVEQEIRELNQQLEARVQARTERLEVANRDLSVALESVRTMQTELVRSEKLAALGSLVAGVAPELNTPIGNSVTVGSTLQHRGRSGPGLSQGRAAPLHAAELSGQRQPRDRHPDARTDPRQ